MEEVPRKREEKGGARSISRGRAGDSGDESYSGSAYCVINYEHSGGSG